MRKLTQGQADLLRSNRQFITPVIAELHEMTGRLVHLCEHEDREDWCPGCYLWGLIHAVKLSMENFAERVDEQLERGPAPAITQSKRGQRGL